MREGQVCQREGITINIFLLPSWSQTEEDVRFAYPAGRVDEGPGVLHRRPRPGPVRGLGLSEPAARVGELTGGGMFPAGTSYCTVRFVAKTAVKWPYFVVGTQKLPV